MNTPPKILIVEDDAILITELQEMLMQLGYDVIGLAATGKTAVESALAQKPDIILMDIRLRGAMTGIQAIEQIHQQLDIPVVYLTAFADEILLQQAKITDAYAYLIKPVRERELRASLEMALYKHSAEQRLQHLNQILRAVRDVNQLITREHDAQHLVDEACQILLRAHGYRFVWIGQSAGDHLKPLAHAGDGQNLIARIVASATPEQGMKLPGTEAARTRRVVVCHDMLQDERYAPWREHVEQVHFSSTVAVPILHEESLFGVLSVYSEQANIFGAEEIDLLLELAGDIAFGLQAIAGEAERKQAEESLRESVEIFHTAFMTSPDSININRLDDGMYVSINQGFTQIMGYSEADIIGKTSLDVHLWDNPEDRQKLVKGLKQDGFISNLEARFLRKDGSIRYGLMSASVLKLGGIPHIFSITRDITERKRAEEALRQQMQELQRWYDVTIERETRALELKHEVNALLRRLNEPPRYTSADPAE